MTVRHSYQTVWSCNGSAASCYLTLSQRDDDTTETVPRQCSASIMTQRPSPASTLAFDTSSTPTSAIDPSSNESSQPIPSSTVWVRHIRICGTGGKRRSSRTTGTAERRSSCLCGSRPDHNGKPDAAKTKASVNDPLFHARLSGLLRIVIPSLRSREAAMLAVHSALLLAWTGLSLYVAELDGRCVSFTRESTRSGHELTEMRAGSCRAW